MKWDVEPYREATIEYTRRLLAVDSPTGFTGNVVAECEAMLRDLGYETRRSNKGDVTALVPGRDHSRTIGVCAHLDTIGLMVRSIRPDGRLLVSTIGGVMMPTLDGEYCRIHTRSGKVYTGTILSLSPAAHVEDDARTRPRDDKNMAVRIDEIVYSKEDVKKLGIDHGDFVCYETKTRFTESGFFKSRFLDDKVSAAAVLTALRLLKEKGQAPRYDLECTFTIYEEIGHGGATLSPGLYELLAVDMGCVGEELSCTEEQVSVCAKDAFSPYDYELTTRLIDLARDNGVDYAVDVYPHYSSDASVAWKAGNDVRAALIGPGVHASHGMERTHWHGVKATIELIGLFLGAE